MKTAVPFYCLALLAACGPAPENTGSAKSEAASPASAPPGLGGSLQPQAGMILIKAGSFFRTKPFPQKVTLSRDFWIGKTEVTQGEYTTLMGVNPSFLKE